MNRRDFLRVSTCSSVAALAGLSYASGLRWSCHGPMPPAFSVVPVVGDGHWIWTEPPKDATGYLEPRSYSLQVGIEMHGTDDARQIVATTPVPVAYPEQKIDDVQIETRGCEAEIRELAAGAGQLLLTADALAKGDVLSAIATFRMTLLKQYHGYTKEQFPAQQKPPADVRRNYLQDSPGIQTSAKAVRALAAELTEGFPHSWDRARRFAAWIAEHIQPQIGRYTSVSTALDTHHGDCEEMAAIFVALCRSVGIASRLVWVPNHNWAEFYLTDEAGQGHWIPVHTACYSWFGWTGAHELVLQKGDRVFVAEQRKRLRLMEDWMQWGGRKPKVRYLAELRPEPAETGGDAGPGARTKDEKGEWKVVGNHELDRYVRR